MSKFLQSFIVITLTTRTFGFALENSQMNLSYGITVQNMESPIFYNTFMPIIYEFKLPEWKPIDLKIQWKASENSEACERSDEWNFTWNKQACPVVFHYNILIEEILHNMTAPWKENTFSSSKKSSYRVNCDELLPHFRGDSLSAEDLDSYVNSLSECCGEVIFDKSLNQFSHVNGTIYEKMFANFRDKSIMGIARENSLSALSPILLIQYALLTNSYTALQAMQILNYYMERERWTDALSSCKQLTIPPTLVNHNTLNQSLNSTFEKLWNKGYRFSIPVDDLSSYYRLPLTDCTFSSNHSLIVRILVPIIKHEVSESLIKVRTVPFLVNSESTTKICQLRNVEGTFLTQKNRSSVLHSTLCKSNVLCKVPRISEWEVADSCYSAIMNENVDGIRSNCQMKCELYDPNDLPFLKKINSDQYAAAGKNPLSDRPMLLTCAQDHYQVIKNEEFGAVVIKLSCGCALKYYGQTLEPSAPCSAIVDSNVNHIMPFLLLFTEKEVENLTNSSERTENSEIVSKLTEAIFTHDISENETTFEPGNGFPTKRESEQEIDTLTAATASSHVGGVVDASRMKVLEEKLIEMHFKIEILFVMVFVIVVTAFLRYTCVALAQFRVDNMENRSSNTIATIL